MIFVFFPQRFSASSQDFFWEDIGPSKQTWQDLPRERLWGQLVPCAIQGGQGAQVAWGTFRTNLYTPAVVFQNPCHLEGFDRVILRVGEKLGELELGEFSQLAKLLAVTILLRSSKKSPGRMDLLKCFWSSLTKTGEKWLREWSIRWELFLEM